MSDEKQVNLVSKGAPVEKHVKFDCNGFLLPPSVREKHRELTDKINNGKLPVTGQIGWIRWRDGRVTDWHVDREYLDMNKMINNKV